jgi:hypothetical protein
MKGWSCWSWIVSHKIWVAVDEGTEVDMRAGAERRQEAAERLDFEGALYVATPTAYPPTTAPDTAR